MFEKETNFTMEILYYSEKKNPAKSEYILM